MKRVGVPVTFTAPCGNPATCGTQTYTGVYYQRPGTVGLNPAQILRNDGRYYTYDGLEISARKRLSNTWLCLQWFRSVRRWGASSRCARSAWMIGANSPTFGGR